MTKGRHKLHRPVGDLLLTMRERADTLSQGQQRVAAMMLADPDFGVSITRTHRLSLLTMSDPRFILRRISFFRRNAVRSFHCYFGTAALVACLVSLPGCNLQVGQAPPPDTRAADEAAVRAASAEWAKVAAAKDLEKTLSYYADDASMFPPNAPVVTGPEARRKTWTGLLSPTELVFSNAATKVEVARSGDLAYETGTFAESFKDDKGNPVKVVGKYVVVWKKQPSGQWKAIVDIFNTDQ